MFSNEAKICSSVAIQTDDTEVSIITCKENCDNQKNCNFFLYRNDGICELHEVCEIEDAAKRTFTAATLFGATGTRKYYHIFALGKQILNKNRSQLFDNQKYFPISRLFYINYVYQRILQSR